jgi:hypothetical protein
MMNDCFRDVGITHLIDIINFLISYGFSWIHCNGFVDYGLHETYILPCPTLAKCSTMNVECWREEQRLLVQDALKQKKLMAQ